MSKSTTPNHSSNLKRIGFRLWQGFWLTFLVVSLYYAWYSFYAPSSNIDWSTDYPTAQKTSSKTGKPIVLFVTGEWCSPCRIMKRTVWADPEVEALVNDKFIPVLINVSEKNSSELIKQFNSHVTPTTILADHQGNILKKRQGRTDKAEILKILSDFAPDR